MKMSRLAVVLGTLVASGTAAYADDPKFTFGKKEEVKDDVIWKASIQLGAAGAYGNSQSLAVNGGFNISRNDGWNKLTLDGAALYGNAWLRTPIDLNGDKTIDDNERKQRTSTPSANNWLVKLRYDRFFTERNSGYLAGFVGQDQIAGKTLLTGGQIGYSRLLLKSETQELAAEIGYDLSYITFKDPMTDPVLVHSARLFLGYLLNVSKETAINASVEAFINGNSPLIGPKGDPASETSFGTASRVIGKAGLTTVIYKNISFKFNVTLKYDNTPAPVTVTLPDGTMLQAGLAVLRAEKLDVLADAGILVTFL